MSPPSPSGLTRRALFGFGLSRLRERADELSAAASPESSDSSASPVAERVADARTRWLEADHAANRAVWSAASRAVVDLAAIEPGERVLAHGGTAGAAGRSGGDVVAFDGDLSEPAGDGGHDAVVSAFGLQRTPAGFAALAGMFDRVRPGGRVAFCSWSSGAVLQLLREAGRVDPLPAGLPPASTWGRDERLRQDLDRHADESEIGYRSEALTLAATSPDALLGTLVDAVPALRAAVGTHGDPAREAFSRVLAPHVREVEAGGVEVEVPYLLVVARRR